MSLLRQKRKGQTFRTPRFFRWFRRNTEAACSDGNRVHLFGNGGDLFPAVLNAVGEATTLVCAEFYIIRNDATGEAFAEALLAAARRGVRVLLLYDYIGCFDTSGAYFRRLESGGVRCLPFNPPPFRRGIAWFDRRNHRKTVIIDGLLAFMGGINVGDEYAGFGESVDRWRDVGVRIEGPSVCELLKLFRSTWQEETGSELEVGLDVPEPARQANWHAGVMIVNGSPHHNRSFIHSAFLLAIAGASEDVKILTPYFVPGPRFIRSLLRAARRRVKVQLVLPAVNDVPMVRLVSRSYYSTLLRAGVEIYERQGTVLHSKVMLIDRCWAVIGSANLDLRSFHRNYEVNVIVDSQEFGCEVDGIIADDLRKSCRILLDEHEKRGWMVRLMERLCAPASWFL